jgi:glutamyl-Q tRNA(Asp) synthetase
LAGFLEARSHGGWWRLRIDDLDPQRSQPRATDAIRRALEALGLHWDGPVLRQSQRIDAYRAALDRLAAAGLIYPCTCSRKDLAGLSGESPVYPGICRQRPSGPVLGPHALRLRVPAVTVRFQDRLQGPIAQDLAGEVGDFILFRRDHVHAYHLATVLDDAAQGITEVLRGIDLLDSTPRQIHLRERLGLPATGYAHLPVLVDAAGHKLGKSSLAPAAPIERPGPLLVRTLALLGQEPPGELARATPAEILSWALARWRLHRLAGLAAIVAPPDPDPPADPGPAGNPGASGNPAPR